MAFASAILPVLGTVASVAGPIIGGLYQGQVASNNAQVEQQNALYTEEAGEEAAAATSLKGAAQAGAVKTSIAANNTDVNSGSAVNVEASEREANALDSETALANANLQAYGYKVQATNDQAQSTQDIVGGIFKGVGGLAANASSLPFQWRGSTPTTSEDDTGLIPGPTSIGWG